MRSSNNDLSYTDQNSETNPNGPIFLIEKIDRAVYEKEKKALEVDRIMKMNILYRPYEEELLPG